MRPPDRRLRDGERPTIAILATWAGVSLILLAVAATRILDNQYPGPDDALRLVQVRDLLAGQPWFDLHQYRMTPPDGTLMHWSRLVDIPIAGMILLFSLFMDISRAEQLAMATLPLLVLLATMLVLGRLAWRLFDRQTAIYTCAVLILMPMVAAQFQPMRIDHHGWQILTIAVAAWAISWRKAAQGGAMAGFAMACGLMISLETIFLSAAFGLVLALRWLTDRNERWWLVSYMQSLAMSLFVLFALTRGLPDLAPHCDVISPPHLGFFLIVAVGASALAVAPAMPRLPLVFALGSCGSLGLGFIAWSEPQCLAPPFSNLDPLVRDYWYLNVMEGRPIWFAKAANLVSAVAQSSIALCVSLFLAARSHGWLRRFWFEYALILAIAFAGGVMTARSMAFAGILSALPFGWLLWRLLKYWRAHEHLAPKALDGVALLVLFQPAAPVILAQRALAPKQELATPRVAQSRCELRENTPLLNQLEPKTIFAPLDIGPSLLINTHHSVVASGHHRAEQAMHDVITSFTGKAADARSNVDRYDADLVVACIDLIEAKSLSIGGGPDGLMTQLIAGKDPDWLEPVDIGGPEELKVWRVVRD